jgi:hypothetical protein
MANLNVCGQSDLGKDLSGENGPLVNDYFCPRTPTSFVDVLIQKGLINRPENMHPYNAKFRSEMQPATAIRRSWEVRGTCTARHVRSRRSGGRGARSTSPRDPRLSRCPRAAASTFAQNATAYASTAPRTQYGIPRVPICGSDFSSAKHMIPRRAARRHMTRRVSRPSRAHAADATMPTAGASPYQSMVYPRVASLTPYIRNTSFSLMPVTRVTLGDPRSPPFSPRVSK